MKFLGWCSTFLQQSFEYCSGNNFCLVICFPCGFTIMHNVTVNVFLQQKVSEYCITQYICAHADLLFLAKDSEIRESIIRYF